MYLSSTEISCGVIQLVGLGAPAIDLVKYVNDDGDFEQVIFSDAIGNRNGSRLATYIKKNKLGEVVQSKVVVNTKTGNKIRTWIWTVDWRAVGKCIDKHYYGAK